MGQSPSQPPESIEDKLPPTPARLNTVKRAAKQGLFTPLHLTIEAMAEEDKAETHQNRRAHWDTEKETEEEAQALCDDYVATLPTDRIPQLTKEDWKLVVRQETKVKQSTLNQKYRFYWILYVATPRQASVLRTRLGNCRHSEGGAAIMILSLSKQRGE
jgi:hypothetical protein